MAKRTKAELIEDAKSKGLAVTDDMTVADIQSLLELAGESAADVAVDEGPSPEVQAAADAVAAAKKVLDEAVAAHTEAVATHKTLTAPAPPVLGKELQIEGGGVMPLPADWQGLYMRQFFVGPANYEHVSEHPETGAWVYRRM